MKPASGKLLLRGYPQQGRETRVDPGLPLPPLLNPVLEANDSLATYQETSPSN